MPANKVKPRRKSPSRAWPVPTRERLIGAPPRQMQAKACTTYLLARPNPPLLVDQIHNISLGHITADHLT